MEPPTYDESIKQEDCRETCRKIFIPGYLETEVIGFFQEDLEIERKERRIGRLQIMIPLRVS